MRNEATAGANGRDLRITSPLAGADFVVDPDVPTSHRIPLTVLGGKQLIWQSDSLRCDGRDEHDYALAVQGEHSHCDRRGDGPTRGIRISVHTLQARTAISLARRNAKQWELAK